jgi:hypothetical protein
MKRKTLIDIFSRKLKILFKDRHTCLLVVFLQMNRNIKKQRMIVENAHTNTHTHTHTHSCSRFSFITF